MIENYKTSRELVEVFLRELTRRKENNRISTLRQVQKKQEAMNDKHKPKLPFLLTLFIFLSLAAATAGEWIDLFNGKDLSG